MMMRAAVAGVAYVGIVFAAGFALGAFRVLLLVPRFGETAAVVIELPVMLPVSWLACRWLVGQFDIPRDLRARFVMGTVAFAVLMLAEAGVSVLGFGRSLSAHLQQYRQLPALIGLAGQLAFAAFPVIQSRARKVRGDQGLP